MTHPAPVTVTRSQLVLPTYMPKAPDRNPMFLEKRVYQGSSGQVYPLPFIDRIAIKPVPHPWDGIVMENEFIRVLILPELGGRIHRVTDKTNGYDLVYHQPVIKPALVGLAGPWISGGIEFNWPQHHRPSTFMPAVAHIERHDDGSATVWCSEHDPMARMKGMHGIHLHPDKSILELKARVYNRTTDTQTFLWWANVATRVHEHYQSFFPADTCSIADHAKRATSTYPFCQGAYYGVPYAERAGKGVPAAERPRQYPPSAGCAPNDLSWYANIPVPTSYMCMGSKENFFGGYDHRADAGLVHVASHHISPGKKQWTWGNHEFGYAWDRNLTDANELGEHAPYIELMAGVYTDNQPDFSFLLPGETKSWSQYWYGLRAIGPAHQANTNAAVSLHVDKTKIRLGVCVTSRQPGARVILDCPNGRPLTWKVDLSPHEPFVQLTNLKKPVAASAFTLRVLSAGGHELIHYTPSEPASVPLPPAATEPPSPACVNSIDELFLTGLHLDQYRHATRMPETYWREALRRDPGDSRCNLALGRWHLRRGEWQASERHLQASIARLTHRNPNPADGEAHYQYGLCLQHQGRTREAYDAFYKATWNHAWQAAGYHSLAEINCLSGNDSQALAHLDRALRVNSDNLRARALKVIVLRRLAREDEARNLISESLELDPADAWMNHLAGHDWAGDTQMRFDVALDLVRAGLHREALAVLEGARPGPHDGTAPLIHYYRSWILLKLGQPGSARRQCAKAETARPDYCFPARLEEISILESAMALDPHAARAPFYLGLLLYARRRHLEAIPLWKTAVRREPSNAIAWRCLGIGSFNILHQPKTALRAYAKARKAAPRDPRLLYEADQLAKRIGETPAKRLRNLARHPGLVGQRDDLSLELCALYNQTGQPERSLAIITSRKFQPWEGGEGQALAQHARTHLALARKALSLRKPATAVPLLRTALTSPENLGEARHLLANCGELQFWLGEALAAEGKTGEARKSWQLAAAFKGDFQDMTVRSFSEMTYYSALSQERLGRRAAARSLFRKLLSHARQLAKTPFTLDFFATSLPSLLLFDDDLQGRQVTHALFMEAQARSGLGQHAAARRLLAEVLRRDPNHALASDFPNNPTHHG